MLLIKLDMHWSRGTEGHTHRLSTCTQLLTHSPHVLSHSSTDLSDPHSLNLHLEWTPGKFVHFKRKHAFENSIWVQHWCIFLWNDRWKIWHGLVKTMKNKISFCLRLFCFKQSLQICTWRGIITVKASMNEKCSSCAMMEKVLLLQSYWFSVMLILKWLLSALLPCQPDWTHLFTIISSCVYVASLLPSFHNSCPASGPAFSPGILISSDLLTYSVLLTLGSARCFGNFCSFRLTFGQYTRDQQVNCWFLEAV